MAIEIIQVKWCDICQNEGSSVAGETVGPVSLGNGAMLELELCEPHKTRFLLPIESILAEFGRPVSEPYQGAVTPTRTRERATGERNEFCLLCDYAARTSNAIRQHYMSTHRTPGLIKLLGMTCPLCGERQDRERRLLAHVQATHGEPNVNSAFYRARAEGDPHGIAAEVMKRLNP